jgi:hypothetical protein
MSSATKVLADPLWEITQGRMALTIPLIRQAWQIAADRGHSQPLLRDFETAVDRSLSIACGSTRNPFRLH